MLVEDRGKNPSCRLLPRKLTLALTSASLGALTQGYTFVLLCKDGFYSAIRKGTTTVADLGLEFDPHEERSFDEYMKRGGPLQLLEAVYCDPCKAKVSC